MKSLVLVVTLVLLTSRNVGGAEAQKVGFVRARGVHFVVDGNLFLGNGFNAYWLMMVASDPSQRNKVSAAFLQASSHGLTVARTWAFADAGAFALQYSPGSYNEQAFKGLDFVVSEARRYGLRVILSLVNNYDNFGGKKQYVEWAREQGEVVESEDSFFTNNVVKGFYKNHVKAILTRLNTITGSAYKDDPTIFAWELMNEPRCPSDPSGKTIQGWIAEMAAHVKSIDVEHMVEAGLEGFYGASAAEKNPSGMVVGTDFIHNNLVPNVDFTTFHSYPDQWISGSSDEAQLSFLNTWLDSHIRDAGQLLQKPLLLTEFGKSYKLDRGFTYGERDAVFSAVYSKVYGSARSGGPTAGALFWQLLAPGMDSYRDGYEVVLAEAPSTTSAIISVQCRKLRYLGRLMAAEEARRHL